MQTVLSIPVDQDQIDMVRAIAKDLISSFELLERVGADFTELRKLRRIFTPAEEAMRDPAADGLAKTYCTRVRALYDEWANVKGNSSAATEARRSIVNRFRQVDSELLAATGTEFVPVLPDRHTFSPDPAAPMGYKERIIEAMLPDKFRRVFVLGCYDSRKTIYTQQSRAFALVYSLVNAGFIDKTSRIAIVGGGFGGVTAGTAAALCGCHVTIFEKAPSLMPLQRDNNTRFLHPTMYSWPEEHKLPAVPVLSWEPDFSGEVVRTALADKCWKYFLRRDQIELRLNARITDVTEENNKAIVVGDDGAINDSFDVAILAIGFGVDRRVLKGFRTSSYWENDCLPQIADYSKHAPKNVFISGDGDGALIDVLRASIFDFRHDKIGELIAGLDSPALRQKIIEIEARASKAAITTAGTRFNFFREYAALNNLLPKDWVAELRARAAISNRVIFQFKRAERFKSTSSALHRFLVYLACDAKIVEAHLSDFSDSCANPIANGTMSIILPNWQQAVECHEVLIRHGPREKFFASVFPKVADNCGRMEDLLRRVDLTGQPVQAVFNYFHQIVQQGRWDN